tara:strand:- start:58323 stop:59024 length:702 start_codon:yes stop_codon:yes gene_type:complete
VVLKDKSFFITGGSGTLGRELQEVLTERNLPFKAPSSRECDILDKDRLESFINNFEEVVHCAAATNVREIEKNPNNAYKTNVIGTINVIEVCKKLNKKLIFISTDYVFDGNKGNYSINDLINPLSKYAKTKAAAELLVRTYDNSLVIRTSFFGHYFPYEKAFTDQWSSKDYVDIIAPKIVDTIMLNELGIAHVGSRRRSIFEIASERNELVKPAERIEVNILIPRDTSLNCKK